MWTRLRTWTGPEGWRKAADEPLRTRSQGFPSRRIRLVLTLHMAIDRDIHDLLFQHDCVIVPGFGGFLTHYRPARLDAQRLLVHPPSKDLSFNKHLVRQDGLLVDQLVRREGMDFQTAMITSRIYSSSRTGA